MSVFSCLTLLTGLVTTPQICWHSPLAFLAWLVLWAGLVRAAHHAETGL